jgi:hypothetical protein
MLECGLGHDQLHGVMGVRGRDSSEGCSSSCDSRDGVEVLGLRLVPLVSAEAVLS